MKTERREILELVKTQFHQCTGKALPVYSVPCANLRDFHTVKKDLKKGLDKMPPKEQLVRAPAEESKAFTGPEPEAPAKRD